MGSWIHDGFLDSRWVPGFTMGSWIHDEFLDSQCVPGFTIGSWIHNGFLVLGTTWHGNILHSTDHKGMARKDLARHAS